ncbi:HAD hydrolase-like protein [Rhizobium favelukesii]|uniref:HAD hydrolase-like protein n=1 Tax=Rhizobium favelukesii TaxID=348824 RepID=UPI0004627264|nr:MULTISPECIES: HAD hydrolase-like protein [Rhizobium]MCA0805229.1 HAD hydrolase-like protein [Rhizobium sp. T1473]MCS0462554.1 HAD hydrolase-like protein [Rhizobium favelukesii]
MPASKTQPPAPLTAAKPNAAHLIEAVKAIGGDLAHTIMVGDADTDAEARAAGTPLILVFFGYTEIPAVELAPDILLRHFDDLVDACATLLNGSIAAIGVGERVAISHPHLTR